MLNVAEDHLLRLWVLPHNGLTILILTIVPDRAVAPGSGVVWFNGDFLHPLPRPALGTQHQHLLMAVPCIESLLPYTSLNTSGNCETAAQNHWDFSHQRVSSCDHAHSILSFIIIYHLQLSAEWTTKKSHRSACRKLNLTYVIKWHVVYFVI